MSDIQAIVDRLHAAIAGFDARLTQLEAERAALLHQREMLMGVLAGRSTTPSAVTSLPPRRQVRPTRAISPTTLATADAADRILAAVKQLGSARASQVYAIAKLPKQKTLALLRALMAAKRLVRTGSTSGTLYRLPDAPASPKTDAAFDVVWNGTMARNRSADTH